MMEVALPQAIWIQLAWVCFMFAALFHDVGTIVVLLAPTISMVQILHIRMCLVGGCTFLMLYCLLGMPVSDVSHAQEA